MQGGRGGPNLQPQSQSAATTLTIHRLRVRVPPTVLNNLIDTARRRGVRALSRFGQLLSAASSALSTADRWSGPAASTLCDSARRRAASWLAAYACFTRASTAGHSPGRWSTSQPRHRRSDHQTRARKPASRPEVTTFRTYYEQTPTSAAITQIMHSEQRD